MKDELIDLLSRLVADGVLTEDQAAGILLNWRAIQNLETIVPLPFAAAMEPPDDDDRKLALIAAAIAAGIVGAHQANRTNADLMAPPSSYNGMSQRRRTDAADALADQFDAQARSLARQLSRGEITLSQWHDAMRRQINQHTIANGALGAGGRIGSVEGRIQEIAREQSAYLSRFADHAAGNRIGAALEMPDAADLWSEEAIAARAAQYSAAGRAFFFEANEAAASEEDPIGWIAQYIAMDDAGTCGPCRRAVGFYLMGIGPYPGQVCLGRDNCRCRRILIFSPTIYAQLTGEQIPA